MDDEPGFEGLEQSAHAANRRFVDAIRDGDPAAASGAYAIDARLLAPSADLIEGRERIASFWRAGLEAGIRTVDRVPLRIDGHGSVAFEIGRYAMQLRPEGGGSVVDHGAYLLVHERDPDGGWSWALEMFTPDGTPETAPRRPGARRIKEQEVSEGD